MNAEEMWQAFPDKKADDTYLAWQYGCAQDKLAQLTLQGTKTATASSYPVYKAENEPVPAVGDYSIILDSQNQAVCIRLMKSRLILRVRVTVLLPIGEKFIEHFLKVKCKAFIRSLLKICLLFVKDSKLYIQNHKRRKP